MCVTSQLLYYGVGSVCSFFLVLTRAHTHIQQYTCETCSSFYIMLIVKHLVNVCAKMAVQ